MASKGPKLILVTGGSGFIGTRIQTLLLNRGYRLRVLTRKPDMTRSSVDHFLGDLTDPLACRQAMKNVNIVIHGAGEKRHASSFWPVNVGGTKNLLTAALDEKIERFVHISSVGVIGADPLKSKIYDEDSACLPRNAYEQSKWEAEKLIHQATENGLAAAILRPANVFGDRNPEQGLQRLIKTVQNGCFVFLGGRGTICNYVFVEDVAHACLALAEHPKAVNRTYHLSDDCTLGEFVDALSEELGAERSRFQLPRLLISILKGALRTMRPFPVFLQSPVGSRLISLNNQARFGTTRLANELGFRCPVGWREGLGRVVRYYSSQGKL